MLQANETNVPPFSVVTFTTIENELASQTAGGPCELSQNFLESFRKATGWVAEFQESRDSVLLRKMPGMENEPASGSVEIVDMCDQWPTGKPTVHRGNCDELIKTASLLMAELQQTRSELTRARSALAALAPNQIEDEDEILVDSFIPKFDFPESRMISVDDSDFIVVDPEELAECFGGEHDDFVLSHEVEFSEPTRESSPNSKLVKPPFAGWSIGGKPGIADQTYVDWRVNSAEQICLSLGKIESSFGTGDAEATLKADPLTSEFVLEGSVCLNGYYYFDSASGKLSEVEFSTDWIRLNTNDSLVVCTSPIPNIESFELERAASEAEPVCVLSDSILSRLGEDACILVLRRDK